MDISFSTTAFGIDLESLNRLLRLSPFNGSSYSLTQDQLSKAVSRKKIRLAIAKDRGKIIGFAYLVPCYRLQDSFGVIPEVIVGPFYRKRGVGRNIIHLLLVQAEQDGFKSVQMSVPNGSEWEAMRHLCKNMHGVRECEMSTIYEWHPNDPLVA